MIELRCTTPEILSFRALGGYTGGDWLISFACCSLPSTLIAPRGIAASNPSSLVGGGGGGGGGGGDVNTAGTGPSTSSGRSCCWRAFASLRFVASVFVTQPSAAAISSEDCASVSTIPASRRHKRFM